MDFNPYDSSVRLDPYPAYRQLREQDPVHKSALGLWFVSRYADADFVLRDRRFGRDFDRFLDTQIGRIGPLRDLFAGMMLYRDPPDHTRLRGLVAKAFTPRVVSSLEPFVKQIVNDLLDDGIARGHMDVIGELAYPLPVLVICQLLGIPAEDRQLFRLWSRDLSAALDYMLTPDVVARADEAARESTDYLRGLITDRRRFPQQDLASLMIQAEQDGGHLTEMEIISTCIFLFGAGHETTTGLIGNSVLALLLNPDQQALLTRKPALIASAIDELLRFDSPVQMAGRVAIERVDLGGRCIEEGDVVVALLGAANRDDERFVDPDRLDVMRTSVTPLSFGGGLHYCLGAWLAKVEARAALEALLTRSRDLSFASPELKWRQTVVLRSLESLPVTFMPRA